MPRLSLHAIKNTIKMLATRTCIYGMIDTPVESSRMSGTVAVAGWAFSRVAPVIQVEAWIDGEAPVVLSYGIERADVAAAHPWRKLKACGYSGILSANVFTAGPRTLTVRVVDARGNRHEFTRTVIPAPLMIHLDSPVSGASCGGLLTISGWAYSPTASSISVRVSLDGQLLAELPCDVARPDVAEHLQRHGVTSRMRSCGFWRVLAFAPARPGLQTLVVQAVDDAGNHASTSLPLRVTGPNEPVAEIDQAEWCDGTLTVTGWAIWPQASASIRARVYLDGSFTGETHVNLSRPDLRRSFPENPAAIRSGFHFRQCLFPPKPSTDSLENLPVDLLVEFTGPQGRLLQRRTHVVHTWTAGFPAGSARIYPRLEAFLDEYAYRFGHLPALLDWNTGLNLTKTLQTGSAFEAPVGNQAGTLPYIDHSIDVVAVASSDPARLDEARRVAGQAILYTGESADEGERDELRIEWLPDRDVRQSPLARVSIIIPVYNHIETTVACLRRLEQTVPCDAHYEILVVDDASSDATPAVLERWTKRDERHHVIRNEQNQGFLLSCNRAAQAATGDIVIFLNNDTLPQAGWLPALLRIFRDYPDAGAVGCKLVYPDGTLQEAGGIVFADGSACNFGRTDPRPEAPLYSYVREVDYCSGACLATPRAIFLDLGSFDPRYAPAYYEDTDYCFRLRERGYRVYYQPESVIVHAEGTTAGRDLNSGVKYNQVVNQARFFERWCEVLRGHPANPHIMLETTQLQLAVREWDTTAS